MFIGLHRITTLTLSFCCIEGRAYLDGLVACVDFLVRALSTKGFSPASDYCSANLDVVDFGVGAESLVPPFLLSTDPPVREDVSDYFPSPLFM